MNDSELKNKGQHILEQLHGGKVKSEVFSAMEEVFPDFWEMTQEHLYGDIWSRPVLSLRDRIIATLAVLQALVCVDELEVHMRYAVNIGLSREEIFEIIMHVMNYSGWPTGVYAMFAAANVFHSKE